MGRFTWINGRLVSEKKASIPISDSAYLYGHGIFETLRAIHGKVLFLKDHLARLSRNARAVGLILPVSPLQLGHEIRRTLVKNRLREAAIRLILSESEGTPRLVIRTRRHLPLPRPLYQGGSRIVLARSVRADSKGISRIKSTSYLTKILARREAAGRGAAEAILIDEQGHLTEGGSSNLFVVRQGRLLTPPIEEGLLPGTRRHYVIRLARRLRIPFAERPLQLTDLKGADEVFITSTLKDILPVRSFDGTKIGGPCPGPITKRLTAAYWKYLEVY